MRYVILAALLLMPTACGERPDDDDQAARDQRDVALVEKANNTLPPPDQIEPETFTDGDVQRYDLLGEQCAYAPGTSLGTRVVARQADAFVKIDGKVERFASDPGSRELPQHSRSLYTAKNYSLRLQIRGEGASQEGEVEIRDAHGRIIYDGTGSVTCSA